MTYHVSRNFGGFGADIGWWSGYSTEKLQAVANAINSTRVRYGLTEMRATAVDVLRAHTRSTEDGGGFAIPLPDGTQHCLCIANTERDVTQQVTVPTRCPSGTGGQVGTSSKVLGAKAVVGTTAVISRGALPAKTTTSDDSEDDASALNWSIMGGAMDLPAGDAAQDPAQDDAEDPAQDDAEDPAQDDAEDPAQDDAEDPAQDDAYKNETLTCPEGMVLDESLTCVPVAEPKPWYKSPWVIGGGIAAGVGIGIALAMRRRRS